MLWLLRCYDLWIKLGMQACEFFRIGHRMLCLLDRGMGIEID